MDPELVESNRAKGWWRLTLEPVQPIAFVPEWNVRAPGSRDPRKGVAEIHLENPNEVPVYAYVYSVSEVKDAVVEAVSTPKNPVLLDALPLEPGGHEKRWVRVVSYDCWELERPMIDRYVVLYSAEECDDPEGVEISAPERESTVRGGSEVRSQMPVLQRLRASMRPTSRGGAADRIRTPAWGLKVLDLRVVQEPADG